MSSFEDIFDAQACARLVGSLVLICGDRAMAEDIAQEALATGWAHWPRISRHRSPRAWVWRCALNAAASAGRRKAAEGRAITRSFEREAAPTDTASVLALRNCIDQLAERQRAAIVCRYYSGLSVKETAKAMGCREGTVKALTSQAIDRLRSMGLVETAIDGASEGNATRAASAAPMGVIEHG